MHLAERIGVSEGGDLNLFDQRFKVRGIYESPSAWENGSMVMAIREMQELIDRKDQVTYFNVALKPPLDPDQAKEPFKPSRIWTHGSYRWRQRNS